MESEIVLLIFSPIFKKAALIMTQTLVGKLDFFAKIIQPADRYAFELQTYPEEQIFIVSSTDFQPASVLDTNLTNSPKLRRSLVMACAFIGHKFFSTFDFQIFGPNYKNCYQSYGFVRRSNDTSPH